MSKEQLINNGCFVLLLCRGICRFCAIFWHFGGMSAFNPLGPPLNAMAPRLPFMYTYICNRCLHNLKTTSAHITSKKCLQILPCVGKLYHRCKRNVPESESRQFGRLRFRLRLLARCHDSWRLRLRLRLRTPGVKINTAPLSLHRLPSGN